MLFRPNFCANCGERIERADWGFFTSRRFCPLCETEFKGHDLFARALVGVCLLVGVLGIGGYLKSGMASTAALPPGLQAKQKDQPAALNPVLTQPANNTQQLRAGGGQNAMAVPRSLVTQPPVNQPQLPKAEATEPSYYCGAETKKGTPCSRKVKGNVRCFQHKGMPAMLPPDKLKIG